MDLADRGPDGVLSVDSVSVQATLNATCAQLQRALALVRTAQALHLDADQLADHVTATTRTTLVVASATIEATRLLLACLGVGGHPHPTASPVPVAVSVPVPVSAPTPASSLISATPPIRLSGEE